MAEEAARRDTQRLADKPRQVSQAERDRDEILTLMRSGLPKPDAKKRVRNRLKREGEKPKTISNRLYEASKLINDQLADE
jgi:hypothetical protein